MSNIGQPLKQWDVVPEDAPQTMPTVAPESVPQMEPTPELVPV